jgi:hypothetical protein
MTLGCPGKDFGWLRVELYKCPNCGTGKEIFSNETKVEYAISVGSGFTRINCFPALTDVPQ